MSTDLDLDLSAPTSAVSPFDQIRITTTGGGEYWSARDLMPLLGYGDRWQNFQAAIERAKQACSNSGIDTAKAFTQVSQFTDAGNLGQVAKTDYNLSRYACYMVAMNGDPRKPEIAAAQTYFAIKTRQAETQPAEPLTGPRLIMAAMRELQAQIEATQQQVEKLEPKAEAFDLFLSTTGDYSVRDTAHVLQRDPRIRTGEVRLRQKLIEWGWLYRDRSGSPRAYQEQVEAGRLVEKPQWHYHPSTGEKVLDTPQVRVTAKGIEAIRNKLVKGAEVAA